MNGLRHYLLVRHRHNWDLLTRFSLVGATGVVVNLLVFGFLLRTGVDPHEVVWPIAGTGFHVRWYHGFSTIAFLAANLWNFHFNRRWTFRSAGRAPWLLEYGPFLAVGLAAQALGLLVLTLLLHPHSPVSLPTGPFDGSSAARTRELWAQAMTIGIVTPVSFLGNRLWTFRAVRGVPRHGPPADRPVEPDRRILLLAAAAMPAVITYGSLLPFDLRWPEVLDAGACFDQFRFIPWSQVSRADVVVNVTIGVPLGFLLMGVLRPGPRLSGGGMAIAVLSAGCLSAMLATGVELLQLLSPSRQSSWNDVVAQIIGTSVGILVWTAVGSRTSLFVRRLATDRDASALAIRLLQLYLPVYLIANLTPFEAGLTAMRPEGRSARPLAAGDGSTLPLMRSVVGSALLGAPIGALAALSWARSRTSRSLASAVLFGISIVAAGEIAQGLRWWRYARVTDLVAGTLGVGIGVAVATRWAHPRARPRPGLLGVRHPSLLAATGAWTLVLAGQHWYPFDFQLTTEVFWQRLAHITLLPFTAYYPAYASDPLQGLQEALQRFLLGVPLGLLLRMARLGIANGSDRATGAVFAVGTATVLLLVMEMGQIFLPTRFPDLTDVLLGVAGALVGSTVGAALELRHAAADLSSPPELADSRAADTGNDLTDVGRL